MTSKKVSSSLVINFGLANHRKGFIFLIKFYSDEIKKKLRNNSTKTTNLNLNLNGNNNYSRTMSLHTDFNI